MISPTEERAVLERAAKVCESLGDLLYCRAIKAAQETDCLGWEAKVKSGEFAQKNMDAHKRMNQDLGSHYSLFEVASRVRSLPLESKEVEAEPVGWIDEFGNTFPLAAFGGCATYMDDYKAKWRKTYTTPQPCPKCAELEAKYQSAAAVTGNMMAEYANMRDQLAKVREAMIEEIKALFGNVSYGPYEHPIETISRALKEKP